MGPNISGPQHVPGQQQAPGKTRPEPAPTPTAPAGQPTATTPAGPGAPAAGRPMDASLRNEVGQVVAKVKAGQPLTARDKQVLREGHDAVGEQVGLTDAQYRAAIGEQIIPGVGTHEAFDAPGGGRPSKTLIAGAVAAALVVAGAAVYGLTRPGPTAKPAATSQTQAPANSNAVTAAPPLEVKSTTRSPLVPPCDLKTIYEFVLTPTGAAYEGKLVTMTVTGPGAPPTITAPVQGGAATLTLDQPAETWGASVIPNSTRCRLGDDSKRWTARLTSVGNYKYP